MSYEYANQLSLKSTNDVIVKSVALENNQPTNHIWGGIKVAINWNVISQEVDLV
jgi:hypothetical protein